MDNPARATPKAPAILLAPTILMALFLVLARNLAGIKALPPGELPVVDLAALPELPGTEQRPHH
jgi:hypothetical protein